MMSQAGLCWPLGGFHSPIQNLSQLSCFPWGKKPQIEDWRNFITLELKTLRYWLPDTCQTEFILQGAVYKALHILAPGSSSCLGSHSSPPSHFLF